MPIRDAAARRKSLRNDYGTDAAADAPTSHEAALFNGDPMLDGVEVTGPGYARGTILPADWADDGTEGLRAQVELPTPTGDWDEATHWALYGSDALWWDCGELEEPLIVSAGDPPVVVVPLFYDDALTDEEF